MSSNKKNIYVYLGKVILITLLIVLIIRCFVVEPFSVSSSHMEATLLDGDEVLIDKTAYGIRMPITLLTVPFTFDQLWGRQSYSTAIQMPYARFFTGQIGKNEVVLFNNPLEVDKPLDKRSLLLSRCHAVPGDTMLIYRVLCLNSDSSEMPANEFVIDSMQMVLPSKGRTIEIDEESLIIYGQTILQEQGDLARVDGEKLYINGQECQTYTFDDDYYWMVSDNPQNSLDSKTLGFIPFKNVIGKARFVWYNSDSVARENRGFETIK